MIVANPAPLPNATSIARGAMSELAQTFGGVKTFADGVRSQTVASALGASSGDRAVTLGSTVADASVSSGAKLVSIGTGIGGSYVEKAWFTKNGRLNGPGLQSTPLGNTALQVTDSSAFLINGDAYVSVGSPSGVASLFNQASSYGFDAAASYAVGYGPAASGVPALKGGTFTSDAGTPSDAQLFSVRTALGGTEVERAAFYKSGLVFPTLTSAVIKFEHPTNPGAFGSWQIEGTPGSTLRMGNAGVTYFGVRYSDGFGFTQFGFEAQTGTLIRSPRFQALSSNPIALDSALGVNSGDVAAKIGTTLTSPNANAKLLSLRTAMFGSESEKAYFTARGVYGLGTITDSSGTPGNATINAGKGRTAFLVGQDNVVITNDQVTADSVVVVQPELPFADGAPRQIVVTPSAGSFRVDYCDDAGDPVTAGSGLIFRWYVVK